MRHSTLATLAMALLPASLVMSADIDTPTPEHTKMASPITRTNAPSMWHAFSAATIEADPAQFTAIADKSNQLNDDVLVTGIPLGADLDVNAYLHEVRSIHPESRFVVMRDQADGTVVEVEIPAPTIVVLAGKLAQEPDSRILLAHGDMGTMGYVRTHDRTFMISSGPLATDQPPLSFDTDLLPEDALELLPLACTLLEIDGNGGQHDESGGDFEGGIAGGVLPCRKIGFAIETDNEYLDNLFGGNENSANAYAALLLAASTEIYVEQLNSNLEIDYMRLWTSSDPWSASNTSNELTNFRSYWEDNMGSVDRDLAHFLSGRGLGGGVAWLGGLCGGSYAYALSANLNGYFPYPIQDNSGQNWDLMVFAHETGHSFGTGHTHDSYNPPIDGCASGDCSVSPNGTIMSYCHLCSGGLTNVRMEFHPRVEAVILDYLDSVSCNYAGAGEGAVAVDDSYSLDVNEIGTLDVLANDVQVSCGAIEITDFDSTTGQGASVTLVPGSGSNRDQLRYSPAPEFTGSDSFSYTIADDLGNQAVGVVSIGVATNVYFQILGDDPDVIYAENHYLEVSVNPLGVTIDPNTFVVSINDGTGWQNTSLGLTGTNQFGGTLPDLQCPGTAQMQFAIDSTSGTSYSSDTYTPFIGFELDDFENDGLGWIVSGDPQDTGEGIWEIGTPDGDNDRGDPASDYDGSGQCWLTGADSGNTDVDGGYTYLVSVRFGADEDTIVRWAQWYDNTGSGSGAEPGADVFTVEISNDVGETWTLVDQVGPSDSESSGGWTLQEIRVADYVEPNNLHRMRWTASDLAGGSVIEAAVDAFGWGECVAPDEGVPGDLNGDGQVDGADLANLLGTWGTDGPADFNGDGIIDGADLAFLLGFWTF